MVVFVAAIAFVALKMLEGTQTVPAFVEDTAVIPPSKEAQVEELHRLLKRERATLTSPDGLHQLELPDSLYQLLLKIIRNIAEGKPVALTPSKQEVTTQQAADYLGMSRQFLIRLLSEGKIPYHKVGTHRRLEMEDVVAYRKEHDRNRHEAIGNLAREAVRAGDYDEF